MKKRIMSLVLCLVMVLGLLPMQTHAEEAQECLNCSHMHWGDYVCDGCGLCSSECSNSDCWYETHCKNCGACYMSADNWCDECGWCQDCMQEAHCQDCKRCFVGESKDELCEDCQRCVGCVDSTCAECHRCSDCADGVCEECNMCSECFDEDEHCQSCRAHLLGDEPCGYCDDCAEAEGLHCEQCGACFEDGAERCPIHEDDTHCEDCAGDYCEECGECEFTNHGLELCDYCGMCKDCCGEASEAEGCSTGDVCVEDGDWEYHFCRECGECFCSEDKCGTCDLCKKCCKDTHACTDCDCAETAGIHTHRYDAAKWVIDQDQHWNECRVCHEKVNIADHKDDDGDGYCDVCGLDQAHPLYISSQPKDLVKKVSNEDLYISFPDRPAPSHPLKNRAQFSVEAHDLTGRTLSYQWYEVCTDKETGVRFDPFKLTDNDADYIKGTTTATLDIGVPMDGCKYAYEFFCEVTATAADGSSTTITSRYARLRTTHNYEELKATDTTSDVTVVFDYGVTRTYKQGSEYHNAECIGRSCHRTKLKADMKHTYAFMEDLGGGHTTTKPDEHKYFYLEVCTQCHHEDLRSVANEDDVPHFITLDAPEGAYAFDVNTEETVTYAKKGAEIELNAPTLNEHGHVFTGWKVVEGDVTLIPNHNPGIYTFYMSADNVELKALYDSSRHPVESIKINTIKVNGSTVPLVNNTVTVKVGDTIEATAVLTPDTDIVDERVLWNVMDFGGGMDPRLSIINADGSYDILSEPTASPVKLKALKITNGKLYLRATAYASKLGTDLKAVSDSICVNIVADSEHVCDYEVTTVYPTCTLKGYTLYTCKDEACGKSYKMQITESLGGHKDTDNDGYCDNLNKNTGELCGFKLSAGGSEEFVGQQKIDKAAVSVAAPVRGVNPGAASAADARYTVANTQWMTEDGTPLDLSDTFAPGTVYIVKVTLEASTGYAFQLKEFSNTKSLRPTAVVKATEFQINSKEVKPGNGSSKDSVNLIYTFAATEEAPHTYSLTTQVNGGNGTISASKTGLTAGSTETVIFTPDSGYEIDTVTVNGAEVHVLSNVLDVVMDADKTVIVTYKAADSGSSSGTGSTAYTVTVLDSKNGSVTADRKTASAGSTVTLTVTPDKGYTLETLTVLDRSGKELKLTEKNGRYTFTMPASNVTVKASFMDDNTMLNFFVDVKADDYYYDAVLWAAENGITGGTDAVHFSPNGICTRAQAVTFLWRAVGSPVVNYAMSMTDVSEDAYYAEAVRWALSEGITKGTSDTTFSPDENCTRAQIVTFLWRSRKSPAAGGVNPFTDVQPDAYYTDAVLWAVREAVTSGTTAATFSPDEYCTRAQIVTFIYRALAK